MANNYACLARTRIRVSFLWVQRERCYGWGNDMKTQTLDLSHVLILSSLLKFLLTTAVQAVLKR